MHLSPHAIASAIAFPSDVPAASLSASATSTRKTSAAALAPPSLAARRISQSEASSPPVSEPAAHALPAAASHGTWKLRQEDELSDWLQMWCARRI